MHDGAQTVAPDEVYALVSAALGQFEEANEVRDDGVWLVQWPSVRISVDRALALRSAADSEAWTAWLDLTCMYNTALPFTAARTHIIGLGNGRAAAVADAVQNWRQGVAPALISFIYGYLKGDADNWPIGDARSVPGWSCISGPYVLRGDPTSVQELARFMQEKPLADPVRERLAAALDASAPFHTVSLYRAQTASGTFSDVLIDNQPDIQAGELLKSMNWPDRLQTAQFIGARHFLLCVAPQVPQHASAPDRHQQKARNPGKAALATILFIVLAMAFGYAVHRWFVNYTESLARDAGEAIYTLVPGSAFWLVPASILGVLFAAGLMLAVLRQENAGKPHASANGLTGIPWFLVAGGLAIAIFMGALCYFAAHSRLQLTADEIVLRRLWSVETEHYPYSRVSALTEEGDRDGGAFSIHLKEAPIWSTRQEVIFPGEAEKRYLETRTRLQVRRPASP
jgi:hypothetical protein